MYFSQIYHYIKNLCEIILYIYKIYYATILVGLNKFYSHTSKTQPKYDINLKKIKKFQQNQLQNEKMSKILFINETKL